MIGFQSFSAVVLLLIGLIVLPSEKKKGPRHI